MKYFAISAVLLISTIAAGVSRAADKFDPFAYVTVGASRGGSFFEGTIDDAFEQAGVDTNAHVGDTWGANLHAGYRFHKFLAAEVEYEWMKDWNMRVAGADIGSIQTQTVTGNLKVVAPYGAFEPYFLVGFGVMWTSLDKEFVNNWDVDTPAFTPRFGIGMDYWITQNMSLSLGAEIVPNAINMTGPGGSHGEGIDYISGQFGFGFRF